MCIESMSEHCLIKKNTPELRKKLEDAGLSVCICTTFEDADWLSCWGSHMSYDIHGVYPDDVDDCLKKPIWRCISRKRIRLYVNRMMSLLTCVNKLKGNDYAVDYLQATIR